MDQYFIKGQETKHGNVFGFWILDFGIKHVYHYVAHFNRLDDLHSKILESPDFSKVIHRWKK